MNQPPPTNRLAYLMSIYPAVSHTFFVNEIKALRGLGFSIDTASINRPESATGPVSALELKERSTTFYIKTAGITQILLVCLRTLFLRPLVLVRGIRAALALEMCNLKTTVYAFFYLAEALLLGDWLRRRSHSHLHVHFGGPVATVGMLTAVAWKFSYSLTIHGPEEFYDVELSHLQKKIENARFVLCISDYCRSQVMKLSHPRHWSKFHVVRLGVDLHAFQPVVRRERNGPLELLCVGRLVPAKGHLILLQAFSALRKGGYDIRLRLVGDGSGRDEIQSLIAQEKLEDCVVLEGALNHEATREKLRNADIFVLASFAEGLPVALMEAMAMQIPCVSTFVAGIPELIRDQVDGLLVPASSAKQLTLALKTLIVDSGLRHKLGVSARNQVTETYDLEKNAKFLAKVLKSFLY